MLNQNCFKRQLLTTVKSCDKSIKSCLIQFFGALWSTSIKLIANMLLVDLMSCSQLIQFKNEVYSIDSPITLCLYVSVEPNYFCTYVLMEDYFRLINEAVGDGSDDWNYMMFVRVWPESVCRISDKTGVSGSLINESPLAHIGLYQSLFFYSSRKTVSFPNKQLPGPFTVYG